VSNAYKLLYGTDGKLVYHPDSGSLLFCPNAVRMTVTGDIEYYWHVSEEWYMRVEGATHYCPWGGSYYYKTWWLDTGGSAEARVEQVDDDPEIWEAKIGYQFSSYGWCWVYYQASSMTGAYSYDREFKSGNTRHDITSIVVEAY
jgi:hypothetical protein